MKYLRKFNESFKPMLDSNNVSDILVDIIDIGYKCNVETDWWSDGTNSIRVSIYGIYEFDKKYGCEIRYIYIDDVIESINRLFDYMKTESYLPSDVITKKNLEILNSNIDSLDLEKSGGKIPTGEKYSDGSYSSMTIKKDDNKNICKVETTALEFNFKQG
jgi:hypothetical protein